MARKNKKKKTLAFKNAVAGYLFIAPFIIGFIPVSYTHLDVYKRQDTYLALMVPAFALPMGLFLMKPVSYTHLKVTVKIASGSSYQEKTFSVTFGKKQN